MRDGAIQYRRELRKALRCTQKTKNILMTQFLEYQQKADDEFLEPTYDQLVTLYGPPEEMAAELMRDVPLREHRAHQRQQVLHRVTAIVLLVALIAFTIYMTFFKLCHVVILEAKEILYINGSAPTTSVSQMNDGQNPPITEEDLK